LVDFVTAIVIQRVGNGGKYFWRRAELGKFHTLRDRIIQEVMLSLEAAKEILAVLKTQGLSDFSACARGASASGGEGGPSPEANAPREQASGWDFEIHADIGEKGETKTMIQEVVGMIRANNFEARTKPDSYAASNVADRHV